MGTTRGRYSRPVGTNVWNIGMLYPDGTYDFRFNYDKTEKLARSVVDSMRKKDLRIGRQRQLFLLRFKEGRP